MHLLILADCFRLLDCLRNRPMPEVAARDTRLRDDLLRLILPMSVAARARAHAPASPGCT
jgi:hypothetical protein